MLLVRIAVLCFISLLLPVTCCAQSVWTLETSGTAASLRGIHAVSRQIAWVSGSGGTILRTLDGGRHWTKCATPPNAIRLDFRAIWAWSARDAIVMSSGPGVLSQVFKTADGGKHWKQMAANADPQGFWDAMVFENRRKGFVLGDPVNGRFVLLATTDGGRAWRRPTKRSTPPGLKVHDNAGGAFAASNTSLMAGPHEPMLFGGGGAWVYRQTSSHRTGQRSWASVQAPLAHTGQAAGVFSLGYHAGTIVAVGGDYTRPADSGGTAAWSRDGGRHWTAAQHPPHGYRSAVAWDAAAHAWITVGTNGTDISYDGGQNWQPLGNGSWNALSLPFAVGPKGRIGRLNSAAAPRTAER
uniref:Photosynthesis system II assembly factor Ycf48/Hcf136-like domain-containing protein n=1 Tax=Acidobacterium capsulatum TaxID=33075 RepID=A0A7V4XSU1_9BACT